jgi:nicotinamidase-related amidase
MGRIWRESIRKNTILRQATCQRWSEVSRDRIKEIEEKIAELKARWPRHSVPMSMWLQLDELEEELAAARKREGGTTGEDTGKLQ